MAFLCFNCFSLPFAALGRFRVTNGPRKLLAISPHTLQYRAHPPLGSPIAARAYRMLRPPLALDRRPLLAHRLPGLLLSIVRLDDKCLKEYKWNLCPIRLGATTKECPPSKSIQLCVSRDLLVS